jgi:hypothetical protein
MAFWRLPSRGKMILVREEPDEEILRILNINVLYYGKATLKVLNDIH